MYLRIFPRTNVSVLSPSWFMSRFTIVVVNVGRAGMPLAPPVCAVSVAVAIPHDKAGCDAVGAALLSRRTSSASKRRKQTRLAGLVKLGYPYVIAPALS